MQVWRPSFSESRSATPCLRFFPWSCCPERLVGVWWGKTGDTAGRSQDGHRRLLERPPLPAVGYRACVRTCALIKTPLVVCVGAVRTCGCGPLQCFSGGKSSGSGALAHFVRPASAQSASGQSASGCPASGRIASERPIQGRPPQGARLRVPVSGQSGRVRRLPCCGAPEVCGIPCQGSRFVLPSSPCGHSYSFPPCARPPAA